RSSALPRTTPGPRIANGYHWSSVHEPVPAKSPRFHRRPVRIPRDVRVRHDAVHPGIPHQASRGDRLAEARPRHLVGQDARGARADAVDAPRAESRPQRAHLRAGPGGRRRRIPLRARRQRESEALALMSAPISNVRPAPDKVLTDIADYTTKYSVTSKDAFETARYCLMDTLGCGFEALEYPACTKLLGPIVPGTVVPNGAKVPG